MISAPKIEQIVGPDELIICKCEGGIAFDRLIQQANSLRQALLFRRTENSSGDECFGPNVQIVSNQISRWFLLDGGFYARRDLGLKLRNYLASELRSEEHTSELQSLTNLVCRLLLEKKKMILVGVALW